MRFVLVAAAVGAALLLAASAARADDTASGHETAAGATTTAATPEPKAEPPAAPDVRREQRRPETAPSVDTPHATPKHESTPEPDAPARPETEPENPQAPAPTTPPGHDPPGTDREAGREPSAQVGEGGPSQTTTDPVTAPGIDTTAAAPSPVDDTAAVQPAALEGVCPPLCLHHLTQELVDQSYDAITDTWTLTFKASLDSILPCLDHVVSCVVGTTPGTSLTWTSTACPPNWSAENQACVRRDFLPAGIDQEFLFTVVAAPGTTGTVSTTTTFAYRFLDLVTSWEETLATVTTTVDLPVRLNLTKTCPDTVTAGQSLTCTLTLTYPAGPGDPIFDLQLTDTPPPGTSGATLTFVSGPGDWHCFAALMCHTHFLFVPGDTATFTFQATVDAGTDGTIVNTATAVAFFPLDTQVTAQAEVTVVAPTDTTLSVTKTGPATASPGGPIEWTITVTNTGANAATGVVVTDVVPAGVEGATIAVLSPGGGTWSCAALVCTMTAGELSVDASAVFRVTATVSATVPPGTNLVNMVGVAWDNETYGPDGAASATQVVQAPPPPPPPPAPPGPGGDPGDGGTGTRVVVAGNETGVLLAGVLPTTGGSALLLLLLAGLALIVLGGTSTRLARH